MFVHLGINSHPINGVQLTKSCIVNFPTIIRNKVTIRTLQTCIANYSPVFSTDSSRLSLFVHPVNLYRKNFNILKVHIFILGLVVIVFDDLFDVAKSHNVNVLFDSGKNRHREQTENQAECQQ